MASRIRNYHKFDDVSDSNLMAESGSLAAVDQHAQSQSASRWVIYEQPLNERIRNFLRLEYLFQMTGAKSNGESPYDTHSALACLIDVGELLQRADIKSDLVKELERQSVILTNLASNPQVDAEALNAVLQKLQGLARELRDLRQLGHVVRNDELVASVRQRIVIAGGTSNFDLPGYHYWLSRPTEERQQRLAKWRTELRTVEAAVTEILGAIRESAYPMQATAKGGMFQKSLEPVGSYQLIRILLPRSSQVFPEISAGRHRFSLRFMELPDNGGRPVPSSEDVEFQLRCCML